MTHTNHRTGSRESLSKDYVIFMYTAKGINDSDAGPKLEEFLRLGLKHNPVNAGSIRVGNMFTTSLGEILEGVGRWRNVYTVFYDKDIHLGPHETSVCIFWRTDDGLSSNVEACIYDHSTTCKLLKF